MSLSPCTYSLVCAADVAAAQLMKADAPALLDKTRQLHAANQVLSFRVPSSKCSDSARALCWDYSPMNMTWVCNPMSWGLNAHGCPCRGVWTPIVWMPMTWGLDAHGCPCPRFWTPVPWGLDASTLGFGRPCPGVQTPTCPVGWLI